MDNDIGLFVEMSSELCESMSSVWFCPGRGSADRTTSRREVMDLIRSFGMPVRALAPELILGSIAGPPWKSRTPTADCDAGRTDNESTKAQPTDNGRTDPRLRGGQRMVAIN